VSRFWCSERHAGPSANADQHGNQGLGSARTSFENIEQNFDEH
jgi:hypothetical protein